MNGYKAKYIPVICFLIAAVGFITAGILAIQDKKPVISVIFFACTMLNVFCSVGTYFILGLKQEQQ